VRPILAVLILVVATAACGESAGGTTDRSGSVTQEQADEAMGALCDIAGGRVSALEDAQAAFQDRAHETLHHVAEVAQQEDPASAAALLEAKSVVESDLEQDGLPPDLAAHAATLAEATAEAIRAIGLSAEACTA
jgi:hypothetical protein